MPGGVVSDLAMDADTPVMFFNVFFMAEMVTMSTNMTNHNIEKKISSMTLEIQTRVREYSRYSVKMNSLDEIEMRAYLGLLLLRGLYKQNMWTVQRIWEERIGHPLFGATMSKDRHVFISSNFSMDDSSTRHDR